MHCHLRTDGLGGTVIADLEYPPRVAFVLLSTLLERFAVDITYVYRGVGGRCVRWGAGQTERRGSFEVLL